MIQSGNKLPSLLSPIEEIPRNSLSKGKGVDEARPTYSKVSQIQEVRHIMVGFTSEAEIGRFLEVQELTIV